MNVPTHQLKVIHHIPTKDSLFQIWISEHSMETLRYELNSIIVKQRGLPPGTIVRKQKISTVEVLHFVKKFGVPKGYILSDELELKLKKL